MKSREEVLLLPYEALHEYAQSLEVEESGLKAWDMAHGTEWGKRLLSDLEGELEQIRAGYRVLPAHHEHIAVVLSGIQGEERKILAMIDKLKNSKKYQKDLDNEKRFVLNVVNWKEKEREQAPPTIVAAEAVAKRKEQND